MAVLRPMALASSSETRRKILANAGIAFETIKPLLDEEKLKKKLTADGMDGDALPLALAKAKACDVAENNPGLLVIGADQILECEGRRFDKPRDVAEAWRQLRDLSGKTHSLISAVSIACDDQVIWTYSDRAFLSMRILSADFMDFYLQTQGEKHLCITGLYQLEGLGSQLFLSVEGDFFTTLGLPLFPLLEFFRSQGILET